MYVYPRTSPFTRIDSPETLESFESKSNRFFLPRLDRLEGHIRPHADRKHRSKLSKMPRSSTHEIKVLHLCGAYSTLRIKRIQKPSNDAKIRQICIQRNTFHKFVSSFVSVCAILAPIVRMSHRIVLSCKAGYFCVSKRQAAKPPPVDCTEH